MDIKNKHGVSKIMSITGIIMSTLVLAIKIFAFNFFKNLFKPIVG